MDERPLKRLGPLLWLAIRSRLFWVVGSLIGVPALYICVYLSLVETDLLEYSTDSGEFILGTNSVLALRAVVSDAVARYSYDEPELVAYMFSLAGVRD